MEEIESSRLNLEIVFQDEHYVAINKPNGLLVHKTKIAEEKKEFALQMLRDQIGQYVHTVHRIDRPTSGVLLFALSKDAQSAARLLFDEKKMSKKYWLLVRGYMDKEQIIDHPLQKLDSGKAKIQEAITHYSTLTNVEMPFSVSRYPTSRYSLVEAIPITGRMHQIRRHFAHLRHYIIGDKRHGDCKHNRYFNDFLNLDKLFLHSKQLSFTHPFTKKELVIKAPLPKHWQTLFDLFGWEVDD